jgi:hypothetical protein
MSSEVTFKIEICVEHLGAIRALEALIAAVNLNMLVKVSSLCEAEGTAIKGTLIGSFIGMNAKMIKEIVPLTEVLSTFIMVALENLDCTL